MEKTNEQLLTELLVSVACAAVQDGISHGQFMDIADAAMDAATSCWMDTPVQAPVVN